MANLRYLEMEGQIKRETAKAFKILQTEFI